VASEDDEIGATLAGQLEDLLVGRSQPGVDPDPKGAATGRAETFECFLHPTAQAPLDVIEGAVVAVVRRARLVFDLEDIEDVELGIGPLQSGVEGVLENQLGEVGVVKGDEDGVGTRAHVYFVVQVPGPALVRPRAGKYGPAVRPRSARPANILRGPASAAHVNRDRAAV